MVKENDLLITNARLLDGTGNPPIENQAIYIKQGRIAKIGHAVSLPGIPCIDAMGATVMPGLIDAHVHLQSVPGAPYRKDTDEQLKEYRYHHLKAYLACGVTSVLDNAISPVILKDLQKYMKKGGAGPTIFSLGPAFYPPGGYLDNDMLTPYWGPHWRASGSHKDIDALFREYAGLENIVGVKVLLEPGFGPSPVWPIHSKDIRKIIVQEAEKRNLPIHVHAYNKKEQFIGLEMGVHCFAHSGFLKKPPTASFIEKMQTGGAYLCTTIASTLEQILVQYDLGRLDNPLLKLTVPTEQLKTAKNLAAWEQMNFTLLRTSSPKWMPDAIVRLLQKMVNLENEMKKCVKNAGNAIVTLHRAGIPIVLGTDTANWPVFINFFHGPSTILELELLEKAGLDPIDIISSATRIPAEMIRKDHDIGTVESGKRADLIIVKEDPLKKINALRQISWTIKDGIAKTPTEWIKEN